MELITKIILSTILVYLISQLKAIVGWFRELAYYRRTVANMPGPKSYWIVGSLPEFKGGLPEFPRTLLEVTAKVLDTGETPSVMRVWMGPVLRVYTLDAESAKVIMNSPTELEKGWDYQRFHDWLGGGMVTSADERWRTSRKQLTPTFHFGKIEEYATVMDEHSRKLVRVLETHVGNDEVDIYNMIKNVSLDIVSETAMGISLNALMKADQPYVRAVGTYLRLNFMRGTHPLYLWWPIWELLGYGRKLRCALSVMKEMSSTVIKERMAILKRGVDQTNKRPDFLDIMLEEYTQERLTFDEMREEVDTFLFAGYDTSSHALCWTLWCLATHVDIQERVYDEIIETFGNSDDEFVSNKSKDMPYMNAVIKESMRIYTPIPLIQRRMRSEVKIGRHTFPKGVTVVIPLYTIHHNHKVFPRHWEFEPENFLKNDVYAPCAYIPFSAGVRNCIGQKYALREIRILLLHLLYNFKFTTERKMLDNKPAIELVLIPTLGIPVRIQKRQHS